MQRMMVAVEATMTVVMVMVVVIVSHALYSEDAIQPSPFIKVGKRGHARPLEQGSGNFKDVVGRA